MSWIAKKSVKRKGTKSYMPKKKKPGIVFPKYDDNDYNDEEDIETPETSDDDISVQSVEVVKKVRLCPLLRYMYLNRLKGKII